MKFNLNAPMRAVDGFPITQGRDNTPVTLRNVLHMALQSDAIFTEAGPAQGSKRPLTQHEQVQRVIIMQLMVGDELEVTTEQASEIKEIARQGLSTAVSVPLAALMDSGGNVEP